ncbi:MAG: hypothetical protein QF441_14025 [Bacteriovoracaceae bacterium]|jgi:hypothetical protein|nr:hypothetical protein [Halobacteriovoraceae bacterium]MDP7321725.1 hypothetical protein [Bacteriovoracaceae bacterium]
MKIIKFLALGFYFVLFNAFSETYEVGDGAQYNLQFKNQNVKLSIYIADKDSDSLSVEYHFGKSGIFALDMWQQYKLNVSPKGVTVEKGFIKVSPVNPPEIMEKEHFFNAQGLQLPSFLFSKEKNIQKYFINKEIIELAGASLRTSHYQKEQDGHVVDFWISEEVKPVGLVKLISKSKKQKFNNYQIEITNLLKNVAAAIDPSQAMKMSSDTKMKLDASQKMSGAK